MKHLSLLTALMLSSSMVYAGWLTEDYKGDCLEMMCDCVEKDGIGYCCPSGTSFNGKGDAHIEYTPCKCLGANTYYNTTSQKCLSKPTCNPCQKLNVATGTCVPDTSKNNLAVGTCGKCNNGSVITDMTKVTPCKTCDTTNWTLTNRANETQVQDVCHMCQNGKVVLKDENKKIVYNNQCVQCLTDTNCEGETACNILTQTCCPTDKPIWNQKAKKCVEKCPTIQLYDKKTIAKRAHRTTGIHDSGVEIGPYECDYKLVLPWWKVDDNLCIEGEKIACKETGIDLGYSHTVCNKTDPGCTSVPDGWSRRYQISKPEVAYILPAGKKIKLKFANVRDAAGNNSHLMISARLEPITNSKVKEKCGGGWFKSISSGRCDGSLY